jgi:hypothetical protein
MADEVRTLEEIAAAAAAQQQARATPTSSNAERQFIERGFVPVATYEDGRILTNPETGERAFVSPGYVTQDPRVIDGIMAGITPAQTQTTQMQEQVVERFPVATRAAQAISGVPFVGEYTEEAVGMVSPRAMEAMRTGREALEATRPIEAAALKVGGAVAGGAAMLPALPALGGSTLGATALRGAGVGAGLGAAEGAVSGYGRGEGDTRMGEAQTGALIGGAVGGAVGLVTPVVGAGISEAWKNYKGRSVTEISKSFGISTDAAKVVRTAIENDDLTAAQAALQRAGSTSMLADAGPSTQRLLDVSVTSGGAAPRIAGEAVTERAREAGVKMTTVLDDILGAPEGAGTLQRGIRQDTQQARTQSYRVAYAQPIDYSRPRGRALGNLLTRVPQGAINRANELMRIEGQQSSQILARIAPDGSVTYTRMPDVRQLDYMTRALGDVAEAQNAAGKLGGTTQLGRATSNLQRQIRTVLRREVPEYGTALDTAADAISRVKAVDLGRDALSSATTREMVRDGMKGASAAERSAAKAGLRSAIDDTLARVNAVATDPNVDIREFQKLANNILRSRATRDKMAVILGQRDADRLYQELDEAVVSLELRAAIARNSATQQRQAIAGTVEDITAPGALSQLLAGEPLNATKRVVQIFTGTTPEARALRKMGIYDEIAKSLVGIRGAQAQQALRLVKRAMAGEVLNDTHARIIARAITVPAAAGAFRAGEQAAPQ